MTFRSRSFLAVLGLVLAVCAAPELAHAYGGPGSVISGIGALLAAVAALVASLFGFIWFPLKRLYQTMTSDDKEPAAPSTNSADDAPANG